ncbi:MAG: GMC family oxidoreductase N-terminal domain-containing protein [Acidimicrobiales bacterium]|nr:GMC family oxidoreductase N-terminal domain-containing protein [Acidimicrobiales bacterium]MCB9393291.1 GMC family oxidoreductase N-terminal domain-containing protein [Acidimicrobiaceae bacterium]
MRKRPHHVVVVGGGTAGCVLAARLSESSRFAVTLLEVGADDSSYGEVLLDPRRTPEAWTGHAPAAFTVMQGVPADVAVFQGRVLGGTSAANGMATLRGLPVDYDGWAAMGLDGWGWDDVADTFIAAERDLDFGSSSLHGDSGPLPVRRWRRNEHSRAHVAYLDGMLALGEHPVADINDAGQLPGIGVFPATIDGHARRVSTSMAYLTPTVRARENLTIRTGSDVAAITLDGRRATGVVLRSGEHIDADEVVVCCGTLWTPHLLMRSGIGPADHLNAHGITVAADLPVGSTMSDHLGPAIPYVYDGPEPGTGGPAQALLVGASNGIDIDYHAFPITATPDAGRARFLLAVFLLRSGGDGTVRFGSTPDDDPVVTLPSLPSDAHDRYRHAFDKLVAWQQTDAFNKLGAEQQDDIDLAATDAVQQSLERHLLSYAHMVGTCPMGPVLDADCRVHGIDGLRVADGSVMPTIPSGNTYLGCVMIAERIADKMKASPR